MERYDIAIIGSGAAGLSAALNAKIRNKKLIVFGNKNLSTKLVKAPEINNYLGFHKASGEEIKEEFINHLDGMGIEIEHEKVNSIYAMGDYYTLMINEKMIEATSIILATGIVSAKSFKGEEEYLGRGVGYCATCDAPLYKDKIVTIVAYNKHEEAEADFMAEVASKVYYIPMYKDEVKVSSKIEIIKDIPVEILGGMKVEKLILKKQEIITDGIFILRDAVSPGQLVPGLEIEGNHVVVDRQMKTNLTGCFAAGDIVGLPYQYIKAAGEGNVAAHSAIAYIDKLKREAGTK